MSIKTLSCGAIALLVVMVIALFVNVGDITVSQYQQLMQGLVELMVAVIVIISWLMGIVEKSEKGDK